MKGTFTLNGKAYNVPINNGPNSLHGGIEGFSYKVFDYEFIEDGVKFTISKDGEGYPGTLDFYAYYTIEEHHFICYEATSNQGYNHQYNKPFIFQLKWTYQVFIIMY